MNSIFRDPEENLNKFEKFVDEAEADLLIFPELALTGYFFTSAAEARQYAESIDSLLIKRIQHEAKKNKISIVTGFLENDHGILYNSAVAIDCNGELIGHYRKVHLFYYEKVVFVPGDLGFPVYEMQVRNGEKIKLGIQICYDWRFPEATRSLVIKGAELIAIPSNIVTTTGMLIETLKVRAFENKVIVAFSDRVGTEKAINDGKTEELIFRGQSCIINYNGDILSMGSTLDESIVYADISVEETRSKNINNFNNIITDRQDKMYFT